MRNEELRCQGALYEQRCRQRRVGVSEHDEIVDGCTKECVVEQEELKEQQCLRSTGAVTLYKSEHRVQIEPELRN